MNVAHYSEYGQLKQKLHLCSQRGSVRERMKKQAKANL